MPEYVDGDEAMLASSRREIKAATTKTPEMCIRDRLASLDPSIPYHLTRFFPCHRLTDRPATPPETVHRLADIARRYLKYVYVGNC